MSLLTITNKQTNILTSPWRSQKKSKTILTSPVRFREFQMLTSSAVACLNPLIGGVGRREEREKQDAAFGVGTGREREGGRRRAGCTGREKRKESVVCPRCRTWVVSLSSSGNSLCGYTSAARQHSRLEGSDRSKVDNKITVSGSKQPGQHRIPWVSSRAPIDDQNKENMSSVQLPTCSSRT